MIPGALSVIIADTEVLLLPQKALYWPAGKLLCVADAHFGKAAAYRALGQPVPRGTTASNLARLDALLAGLEVDRVAFLGDFLHAPESHSAETLDAVRRWRECHHRTSVLLIRGNHDLRAGDPPRELGFEVVDEPWLTGPFALQHAPRPHATHHALAGHLHPVFRLRGKGKERMRLPCFQTTARLTVLPSFGAFTGGHDVLNEGDTRLFVTDGSQVLSVPRPAVKRPAERAPR